VFGNRYYQYTTVSLQGSSFLDIEQRQYNVFLVFVTSFMLAPGALASLYAATMKIGKTEASVIQRPMASAHSGYSYAPYLARVKSTKLYTNTAYKNNIKY
jgi:hypothetical protein